MKTGKRKTNAGFWITFFLLFAAESFIAWLLKDRWPGVAALFALWAALAVSRIAGKPRALKSWIAIPLTAALGITAVAMSRPDMRVSFQGNLLNEAIKFNTLVLSAKTPEEMASSLEYTPYSYGNWKPPAGYANEKIELPNCPAYFLSKNDGDHSRVIYQIHGGAYVLGFNDNYNKNAVMLSKAWDGTDVFSVDYRSAAVTPYPAALDDALDGWQWLLNRGYSPENIVVAGDSAGGGLSLALTLKLRDEGAALPRCLVLASPWADLSQKGNSYTMNRKSDAAFGSLDDKAVGRNALPVTYANGDSVYNPYISPVYAQYEGMPPMLIQTGEPEMLLSDSVTVVEKAQAADVDVLFKTYPGMWHTFYTAMAQFREQKEAWKTIEEFLR